MRVLQFLWVGARALQCLCPGVLCGLKELPSRKQGGNALRGYMVIWILTIRNS